MLKATLDPVEEYAVNEPIQPPHISRFGKPVADVLRHKSSFFDDNSQLLDRHERAGQVYSQQPRRTRCKLCSSPDLRLALKRSGVDYLACGRCGHFSGAHQETVAYERALYDEGGAGYASTYGASSQGREAFDLRVRDIYRPKADFLAEVLVKAGTSPSRESVLDVGGGAGHFAKALVDGGFSKVTMLERSDDLVAMANRMCPGVAEVGTITPAGLEAAIDEYQPTILSLIGVLEHLDDPAAIVQVIQKATSIRRFFFSVPKFSASVFFEAAFPSVGPRHLTAGHTHLFTEPSLDWLRAESAMTLEGRWEFGSDFIDLFRGVEVVLQQQGQPRNAIDTWRSEFVDRIDGMQLELDKSFWASETHQIWLSS